MTLVPYLSSVRGRVKKNQWLEEMLLLLKGKNGTGNLASIFSFLILFFLHRAFIFTKASASFLRFSTIPYRTDIQLISVTRILVNFSTSLTRFNSSALFSVPFFLFFFYTQNFQKHLLNSRYSNGKTLFFFFFLKHYFYFDLLES